jgi:HSP20 family protein
MSLIKKTDWPSLINGSLLSDFFDNDRFFDADWLRKQSVPAVNVKETEKTFEIEVAAPGLTKKDFHISADNGVLTITSEKQDEKEEKENNYTRKEFSYSSFSRSFTLPENVNEEDVKAYYEDGILKLHMAKKMMGSTKPKKLIEVR